MQTPWRLKDDPAKLQTCFVGAWFFRTLNRERERIFTAMAQVFNERGKGVVVRGGPACALFTRSLRRCNRYSRRSRLRVSVTICPILSFGEDGTTGPPMQPVTARSGCPDTGSCRAVVQSRSTPARATGLRAFFFALTTRGASLPAREESGPANSRPISVMVKRRPPPAAPGTGGIRACEFKADFDHG